jgi:hypothetical protein
VTNTLHGFNLGAGNTVRDCSAASNVQNGFVTSSGSTLNGVTAYLNVLIGISLGDGSTANACTARSNGTDGIFTANDCTVTSCTARRNDGNGINANTGCTVSDCTAGFNGADGIRVNSNCLVRHNNCSANSRLYSGVASRLGIFASGFGNRIDENNAVGNNGYGIGEPIGGVNITVRNTASGNVSGGYSLYSAYAHPVDLTGQVNFGSNVVGANFPWVNFIY